MKKKIKRLLCTMLSVVLVMALFSGTSIKAADKWEGLAEKEFYVQKPDGNYLYKMQVSEDMLSFKLNMTNLNTGESTLVIYDNAIVTTYNTTSSNTKHVNLSYMIPVSVVDYSASISIAEANRGAISPMGYSGMTACIIPTLGGNNLWYQMGITYPDVGYMKMGCDWTYRVKADACDDCANFRNKILESNEKFILSGLSNSAGLAAAIAVLLAGPTGGLSALIAMGLVGTAATTMVAAAFAMQSAHDSYNIAKGYGVVIEK